MTPRRGISRLAKSQPTPLSGLINSRVVTLTAPVWWYQRVIETFPRSQADKNGPQKDWKVELWVEPGHGVSQESFYTHPSHTGKVRAAAAQWWVVWRCPACPPCTQSGRGSVSVYGPWVCSWP